MQADVDSRNLAGWLLSGVIVLGLLVVGRPLLVPFAFALLIWAVLNALTDALKLYARFPTWLAWPTSLALVIGSLYAIARIMADETSAIAAQAPGYYAKLEQLTNHWLHFLRLGPLPALSDLFSASGVADMLGQAAASAGGLLFDVGLVAVYVGFLLAEQNHLPGKLAKLDSDSSRRDETGRVIHAIARQLQAYLGVCTLLSAVMAAATYALLRVLGVQFAGFWALVMFLANYIPTIGGAAVFLPAVTALIQLRSLSDFVLVGAVLFGVHFVLMNIVINVMLGHALNLSPIGMILALSFWGLIWGISGLFLAVPLTSAFVIVCEHIKGLEWFAIAMSGPPPRRATRKRS